MTTNTEPAVPVTGTRTATGRSSARLLPRVAGTFALLYVVLVFAGLAISRPALMSEGVAGIRDHYLERDLVWIFAGGYLEVLAFLLLLPVLVFLARHVGRRTEIGRWAGQTALAAGVTYVAITLAVGFPAGAVSAYAVHGGLDLETGLALNDLRVFAYLLSLAVLAVHAIGVGVSALQDGAGNRWIGWGGVVTGVLLLGAAPLGAVNAHDLVTLAWMVWWVGVAVQLLRRTA